MFYFFSFSSQLIVASIISHEALTVGILKKRVFNLKVAQTPGRLGERG